MNLYQSHVPGMHASGHSARTRTRALVKARVRAVGQEFGRGLPAPGRIPQSSGVHQENGLGCLARISCSRPAALLNLMPIFFRFRVLESEPPTSELGGSEFFANICAKSTDDVVSFLSQLCGSDRPATSVWIEVVITVVGMHVLVVSTCR